MSTTLSWSGTVEDMDAELEYHLAEADARDCRRRCRRGRTLEHNCDEVAARFDAAVDVATRSAFMAQDQLAL